MAVLLPFPIDACPTLYFCRHRVDDGFRIGVMGLLNRREANVLRHEKTMPNRVGLRCEGSLWLWCDTELSLDGIPESDGEHQIWPVTNPGRIRELQGAFEGKELFLADGHHRYAAGWNVATIETRSPLLRSRPSHRLILETRGLRLPKTQPINDVDAFLTGTPPDYWRAAVVRRGCGLCGIEILQDDAWTSLFGDAVIEPIREIPEAIVAVESGRAPMAMLVAAYTIDQIETYARRGILLPSKSTDFYPKLHFVQNENVTPATAQRRGVR